jgi:hypothetical protein
MNMTIKERGQLLLGLDFIENVQTFAKMIATGTLSWHVMYPEEGDPFFYKEYLLENRQAFMPLCAVFINNLATDLYDAHERSALWLRKHADPMLTVTPAFEPFELDFDLEDQSYIGSFKRLAHYLAHKTTHPNPHHPDYFDVLMHHDQDLAHVFALWGHLAHFDRFGRILNETMIYHRISQYIRYYYSDDYEGEPPSEEWIVKAA